MFFYLPLIFFDVLFDVTCEMPGKILVLVWVCAGYKLLRSLRKGRQNYILIVIYYGGNAISYNNNSNNNNDMKMKTAMSSQSTVSSGGG